MFYFIIFFFTNKMAFLSHPLKHRKNMVTSNSVRQGGRGRAAPPEPPDTLAKSEIVSRRGGSLDVHGKLGSAVAWGLNERKPTKLLLNVNLQNSLGPVQVVMLPENTVGDLIKAVVEIYVREKRRPLLASSDPRSFKLHYSQFSLDGLKTQEKLKNLVSRNFFVCKKPGNAVNSSCWDQAKADSPFPILTKLMDFLL